MSTSTSTQTPHFLTSKSIAISGAGISGLAFALSLHKLWPGVSALPPPRLTIYERDVSAAPPGRHDYTLSLRSDGPSAGIQTLQKLGLLDGLCEVGAGTTGAGEKKGQGEEGFVVWDQDWKPAVKLPLQTPKGCPVSGLQISQRLLRKRLVEAVVELPGVEIRWDTAITSVSVPGGGAEGIDVQTADWETDEHDLLVAAEGSHSRVRAILRPEDELAFAGPTCISGTTALSHHPSGNPLEFGTVISGTGVALSVAPGGKNTIVWSLSWMHRLYSIPRDREEKEVAGEHNENGEVLRREARKRGKGLGVRFQKMLASTQGKTLKRVYAMDKPAFPHTTTPPYITCTDTTLQTMKYSKRVVFVGDANHALSQFVGNGANSALVDGWDLAEALIGAESIPKGLKKYDEVAMKRAKKAFQLSHWLITLIHAQGWLLWVWMCVLRVAAWMSLL